MNMNSPLGETAARDTGPFLVMSRCEELWDLSGPVCLLGAHIRRHTRQDLWNSCTTKPIVLEPWAELDNLTAAAQYVDELAESWLPIVAAALNAIHGQDHSVRYWRLLLGNWLCHFLGALYDRSTRLNQALALYPNAQTILLSPAAEVVPLDLYEFHNLLKGDIYNHQLYSQLLRAMGRTFPTRRINAQGEEPIEAAADYSPMALLKGGTLWVARHFPTSTRVVMRSTLAERHFMLRLIAQTIGRHWPILTKQWRDHPRDVNHAARSILATTLPGGNEFERLAAQLIGANMPQTLIEGHATVGRLCSRQYPKRVTAIVSANAWYWDELFKHWAAAQAEAGVRLVALQHGGNYGSWKVHTFERHERRISDRFISWGWDETAVGTHVAPGPAWKLLTCHGQQFHPRVSGILFVATHAYRHPFLLAPFEVRFSEYLEWQRRFYFALPVSLRSELRLRLHSEDLGWDMAVRWKEWDSEVQIEKWGIGFRESLGRSRLYVCDHLSTTFLEALASNIPTVLFWDPLLNPLRAGAEAYYQELRDAGILCDTPEQASNTAALAYADVTGWWLAPARQAARRRFCQRFARDSKAPVREWRRLVDEGWDN